MQEFKKGDRVKYTSGKWGDTEFNPLWGGLEGCIAGTVKTPSDLDGHVFVNWDNGISNNYDPEDLELCVPEVINTDFKVGDKVRVTDPLPPDTRRKGEVGVVVEVAKHDIPYPYKVRFEREEYETDLRPFGADELTKVPDLKYQIGDAVVLSSPEGDYEQFTGKKCIISKHRVFSATGEPRLYPYDVKCGETWVGIFRDSELSPWVEPVRSFDEPTLTNWKVRYYINRDGKGQPTGVVCVINHEDMIAFGKSKCNRAAGDVFTKKQGKADARRRAEFAIADGGTAYFKGGEMMFGYPVELDEKEVKQFNLEGMVEPYDV